MRRAALAAALALAAASLPGAAASGIGLSASPERLTLVRAVPRWVTVRNPGASVLVVDVSRASVTLSLRGQPQIGPLGGSAAWLRVTPQLLRIAAHGKTAFRVEAMPPGAAAPGDHPALVLLTTRVLGGSQSQVRLRLGLVATIRVAGRIVRNLTPLSVAVQKSGARRLLDLRLANRGNVTEQIDGSRLQLVLRRNGKAFARLRPRPRPLFPRSTGIVEFAYSGPLRGAVVAQPVLTPAASEPSFRITL